MTFLTTRNRDDDPRALLRLRAALHGRAMKEGARSILRDALQPHADIGQSLVDSIRAAVAPCSCVDLEPPPRELQRDPPEFL